MTNNINNKDQCDDAIEDELIFYNKFSLSSAINIDPLILLTVRLREVKEHRATIISGLECLWDSGATNITIKRIHNKTYYLKMHYEKVECSTAAWPYCTMHDIKLPFYMPDFYSSRIILHHFNVDNN